MHENIPDHVFLPERDPKNAIVSFRQTLKAFDANCSRDYIKSFGRPSDVAENIVGTSISKVVKSAASKGKRGGVLNREALTNAKPTSKGHAAASKGKRGDVQIVENAVLCYPPQPGALFAVMLTSHDQKRLEERDWFNDSLIDYYCRSKIKDKPEVFTFSATLWQSMCDNGPWKPMSRGEDIFSRRFVNIFANPTGAHWSLCTIVGLDILSVCNIYILQ